MLKYEYLTIMRGVGDTVGTEIDGMTEVLNKHTKEGWWLFAIYPYADGVERVVFERIQEKKERSGAVVYRGKTRTLN